MNDSDTLYNKVNIVNATELHINMFKKVTFMSCTFYKIKINNNSPYLVELL